MRYILLITGFIVLFNFPLLSQDDSIPGFFDAESILTASPKSKAISVDLTNPDELEVTLQKIHTYKYLESIVLEGSVDEKNLGKILLRLSNLKNLANITLKGNELTKMPENIATIKTLESVTIEDNKNLDYTDLCSRLKNIPLNQLNLIDDDIKKTPSTISQISSLKKIQLSGSDQLDYSDFIDQLAKLPALTTLSIPVNYISELPKNIDKLKLLQVLDVSNNALAELPQEISSLKAINNLSIQGNLLLNTARDLEKLKGNDIQYLALDKEISGNELEQIKKMFPNAQIDFPLDKEENNDEAQNKNIIEKTPSPGKILYNGELKAKKQSTILSGAYLSFPAYFQGLAYNFDTLNFEERYNDLRYRNVYQIISNGIRSGAAFHFRKTSLSYEKPGKKNEIWFRFATNEQVIATNYPELRAFEGMYWVYAGELNKKKFNKKYLFQKHRIAYLNFLRFKKQNKDIPILWNDIRLDFDKNNSLFTIIIKNDKGFEKFMAYPVLPDVSIDKSQQTYNRRFLLYQKALLRRSQNFKRNLTKNRNRYDTNYKKMKEYAWTALQSRMSDEEKEMSMEQWLDYYDGIVANEQDAIDNTSLSISYILRDLVLRGYSSVINNNNSFRFESQYKPNSNNYKFKIVDVDFYDAKGSGKLPVSNIIMLDNKNKMINQIAGTLGLSTIAIPIQQFASVSILVELRNGNWGIVSSEEIDKQVFEPNKTYRFNTLIVDKNLDTIGNLLKEAGIK